MKHIMCPISVSLHTALPGMTCFPRSQIRKLRLGEATQSHNCQRVNWYKYEQYLRPVRQEALNDDSRKADPSTHPQISCSSSQASRAQPCVQL